MSKNQEIFKNKKEEQRQIKKYPLNIVFRGGGVTDVYSLDICGEVF
jgi:hypothetical protein